MLLAGGYAGLFTIFLGVVGCAALYGKACKKYKAFMVLQVSALRDRDPPTNSGCKEELAGEAREHSACSNERGNCVHTSPSQQALVSSLPSVQVEGTLGRDAAAEAGGPTAAAQHAEVVPLQVGA